MTVRVYIPATFADLRGQSISAAQAFAATQELQLELDEHDTEALEFAAFLAAVDASLEQLTGRGDSVPLRRVVLAADVPARQTAKPAGQENHPAGIVLEGEVGWSAVAAIHVDEPSAADDVAGALAGDAAAAERLWELDLLWYAPEELAGLIEGAL
ncbi:MAG: hypothetical protein LBH48_04545 [Bifidobacteriaceae bacterium]|jgi:hypothetical protein|nr:hypothetical protein [Bifidobacteriaceae bacterium]